MQKYEFTGEVSQNNGHILYRIRRIADKLRGGWIEREENLSQQGLCFVYGNAIVTGDAVVRDDALVCGNAQISGSAQIRDSVQIRDHAKVGGIAQISDVVHVWDNASVYDEVKVSGRVHISGNASIYDEARLWGSAVIQDNAHVYGAARVEEHAKVTDSSEIFGTMHVTKPVLFYRRGQETITVADSMIAFSGRVLAFEGWENQYRLIARQHRYTRQESSEYYQIIKHFIKIRTAEAKVEKLLTNSPIA